MPIENVEWATRQFLFLGADVEVLQPRALRASLTAAPKSTASRYA